MISITAHKAEYITWYCRSSQAGLCTAVLPYRLSGAQTNVRRSASFINDGGYPGRLYFLYKMKATALESAQVYRGAFKMIG